MMSAPGARGLGAPGPQRVTQLHGLLHVLREQAEQERQAFGPLFEPPATMLHAPFDLVAVRRVGEITHDGRARLLKPRPGHVVWHAATIATSGGGTVGRRRVGVALVLPLSQDVVRVDDRVGIALLGQEALPVRGIILVDGVPADHRVEVRAATIGFGAQHPAEPLRLLLP